MFDENLSRRLVVRLALNFPGATHVALEGLENQDDLTVWEAARDLGLAIVSKDGDFRQLSSLFGAPPKVIWLRAGNCSTNFIEQTLLGRTREISDFLAAAPAALLVIDP